MRWFTESVDKYDLTYQKEKWDCDDFSRLANAMADLARVKSNYLGPPQLIGRLVVAQVAAWAGTPAGGNHELIIFRSGAAWWVAEPQNGTMVSLWDYPNRRHIREIYFN